MKSSVAVRQSCVEIKNTLESLAIGLQLSTDEEFEIVNYMGLKFDDYHIMSIFRRKQKTFQIQPFHARVYLMLDATMKISIYSRGVLGSIIHDFEELYNYRIDVEKEEINIFFNEPSEIVNIMQILLKESE